MFPFLPTTVCPRSEVRVLRGYLLLVNPIAIPKPVVDENSLSSDCLKSEDRKKENDRLNRPTSLMSIKEAI